MSKWGRGKRRKEQVFLMKAPFVSLVCIIPFPMSPFPSGHRVSVLGMGEEQRTGSFMPVLTFLLGQDCVHFMPLASFSVLSVSFPTAHFPLPKPSHPWPTPTQRSIQPWCPSCLWKEGVISSQRLSGLACPGDPRALGGSVPCSWTQKPSAVLNWRRWGGASPNELKHNCPGVFSSTKWHSQLSAGSWTEPKIGNWYFNLNWNSTQITILFSLWSLNWIWPGQNPENSLPYSCSPKTSPNSSLHDSEFWNCFMSCCVFPTE